MGRFCHLVWFWMTDGADPAEVRKVEAQLWMPPKGEAPKGVWSPEAEMEAFGALKAALGK